MWKKPTYQEYNCDQLSRIINVRATSPWGVVSWEDLRDRGEGASALIALPEGVVAEAYVAVVDTVNCLCTFVVNGAKRVWNWMTGIFS